MGIALAAPPEKRENILCDRLNNEEKQSICNEIMENLIYKRHGRIFRSFLDIESLPSPPSGDPYTCKERSIHNLNMEKRMFLCKSRWFRKGALKNEYGLMEGFFCAGSRKADGRVFAFRPPIMDNRKKGPVKVSPVAELDNVDAILQYVPNDGGLEKDPQSTSPLEKAKCVD